MRTPATFVRREPGSNAEILNTLKYVRPGNGFEPTFPLMEKMDVNGLSANKLWSDMRSRCASPVGVFVLSYYPWTPVSATDVAWNFEKVLLDSSLRVIKRYATTVSPASIADDIKALLA